MASRRINFTGRLRLRPDDVEIRLDEDTTPPRCEVAKLDLTDYNFPEDALVFVESYRQTSYMRFPCGTVGNVEIPDKLTLEEFDSPDGIKFRVKVTSAAYSTKGMLLAELNSISDRRLESLLIVKPDSNLDQEVFRVDFTDEPILLINAKIDRWKELATEPVFRSLVYPTALRTILTRVLTIEGSDDSGDPDDWRAQWIRFAKNNLNVSGQLPDSDDSDAIDDWVNRVLDTFCRENKIYDSYAQSIGDEDDL